MNPITKRVASRYQAAMPEPKFTRGHAIEKDENKDYVQFGDVARRQVGEQAQYASKYLDVRRYPEIAEGIRWKGDLTRYHDILIHKDDVEKFVERALNYRRRMGIIR